MSSPSRSPTPRTAAVVGSIARIEDFARAQAACCTETERCISDARRYSAAVAHELECAYLARKAAYENGPEISGAYEQMVAAQGRRDEARELCDSLAETCAIISLATERLRVNADPFLRRRCNTLRVVNELQLDMSSCSPAAPSHTPVAGSVAAGTPTLPSGLTWVLLSEVEGSGQPEGSGGNLTFDRSQYEYIRESAKRFHEQVLPLLCSGAASSDRFGDMDRTSGATYEAGLQSAFDCFLGAAECIYLSRGRNDSTYQIINGRHRIQVARDLGWTAIPARTKDLRI